MLDRDKAAIYGGSANPGLTAKIAAALALPVGNLNLRRLPDSETHVQVGESVRGKDVYVVQSITPPVNEHLVELLVILDALRRASVDRLTAIIPYYAYSRQEKKSTGREPISAKLVADIVTTAGADRVVSIDLHSPAIQGFFNIRMDHLTAVSTLVEQVSASEGIVVVAPDLGRAKFADRFAEALDAPLAIIHKRRLSANDIAPQTIVGDVENREPILVDDIISTGGTIRAAVTALLSAGAQQKVRVLATHGLLASSAAERLNHPAIQEIIVTDTIESQPGDLTRESLSNLRVVTAAPLLSQAIQRLHQEQSISELYPTNYRHQPV